jgi:hypothetical protein
MTSEWAEPIMAIFTSSSWKHEWKDLSRAHPSLSHLHTSILEGTSHPGLLVSGDSSPMYDYQEPSPSDWALIEKSLKVVFNRCLQWLDFGGLSKREFPDPARASLKANIAADPRLALKANHPPYPSAAPCRAILDICPTGNEVCGPDWRIQRARLCLEILRKAETDATWTLLHMSSTLEILDSVVSVTSRMPSRTSLGLRLAAEDVIEVAA